MWNSVIELQNGGEKKMTAVTLLSQKKMVVAKRGWWVKVWDFGSDIFFFIINFSSYPTLLYVLWPIHAKNRRTSSILSPKS